MRYKRYTKLLNVMLTEKEYKKLQKLSIKLEMNMSECVRKYLFGAFEREGIKLD